MNSWRESGINTKNKLSSDQSTGRKSKSKKKSESKNKDEIVVFMIVSDEQGAISVPYKLWSEEVKKFIKQHGARWCPVFKIWKTSRVQLQFIKRDLSSLLTADYQDSPIFVKHAAKLMENCLTLFGNVYEPILYNISEHPLYERLYPFQRQSLEFSLSRHGRILIADEMGIGKSVQSLACSLLFPECFPLLVICPSSLKHVWRDEALKWLQNIIHEAQVTVVKKGTLKQGELSQAKIVITSYEIASKLTDQLSYCQTTICDEAHYLKNPEAARCKLLIPFLMRRKRIFLLTGTPALAKPKQLFNLLNILRPDIFKRVQDFGQRYCDRKMNPWTHRMEFDGAKNLAELHYLLRKTVMIRRLKSDVLTQLPSKQRQIIMMETEKSVVSEIQDLLKLSVSASQLRESDKLINLFGNSERQGEGGQIMRCYMLSATAKLQSMKEYIGSILENDIKIIIFAHHKFIMDQLEIHIKGLKYSYIRLDGEVTPETRKKKVDMFQEDSSIKVALLSVTAMGTGFTLTAASTVIFAELHWTPAVLIQAQDRSHRIGQKSSVNIHYLIGDKTLDPIMLRQLERKVGTVSKVLDGENQDLKIERIPMGGMGSFEKSVQEFKSKTKKITDYFSIETHSKSQKVEDQPQQSHTQQYQDQRQEQEVQTLTLPRKYGLDKFNENDSSDDSCMLEFLRSKKKMQNKE